MKHLKPFPKTERKVVTVTIDESGDMVFLRTPESDVFLELGETITRRASHVEPYALIPRLLFTAIRYFVHDDSRIAAWTRNWKCSWRVNCTPVGGPILRGYDYYGDWILSWDDRQEAIRAEVKFLNRFFLEGK
jgi:hypothetical protein